MIRQLKQVNWWCSRTFLMAFWVSSVVLGAASCGSDGDTVAHEVFFVGYVYDGASGKRLAATELTAISLKYRDRIIKTTIDADGRFTSLEPLPTWQDYSVYVGAPGYRPFVSYNAGVDIPKSLQMTDGANTHGTVQTLEYAVRLFPLNLKAPKVTITIEKGDALVTVPAPERAAGTIRLTPTSSSLVQQAGVSGSRVWENNEDLLTQTMTKPFKDGSATIAEGELVYGVTYQIAIFDVDGYQPFVGSSAATTGVANGGLLNAGAVTSLFVTLQPKAKAALRILGTNADKCVPPLPTADAYAATIDLTFSEEIEASSLTFAEDIDNAVSVTSGTSTSTSTSSTCPLNSSTDASKQERGTSAVIAGRVLSLSFNPAVGFATVTSFGTACMPPAAITAVIYNLANVSVQPKGDPVRKASIGSLLAQFTTSASVGAAGSVSCPVRVSATTSSF